MMVEEGYCWRWLSGDVVEIDIAESPGVYRRSTHRLFGMNAPHSDGLTKEAAEYSCRRMAELTRGKTLYFSFIEVPAKRILPPHFKKYGRRLVRIFFEDGVELSVLAISEGLGVPHFMGLGRRENPFRTP